jgi:uncharacterized protein (TIGR02453 family)
MTDRRYFTPETFAFLRDLAANNNREWFQENKERYERQVKEPALHFITDFAPCLKRISPHFQADPRPVGGSLFRIHRDVRFSKDKSPYKTHTGIQFRHDQGKDAHAPGFYLHIQPRQVFVGVGSWRPASPALRSFREAIVEDPSGWKRATGGKRFQSFFEMAGDSLVRPPRGFDPDHPLVEDLMRKDFTAISHLPQNAVLKAGFMEEFAEMCRASAPFMRFLCTAVGAPF